MPTPESPENIPSQVVTVLEESNDSQLRDIIHYAQQLLHDHTSFTDAIEAREGEELVRMENYDTYTIVVVERPAETGEARGPFAYRVQREPELGDEDGQYRWHYLGKVVDEG